jgi:tetratricopeptide (TPR) repeat protein
MLAHYYQIHSEQTQALETFKLIVQNFPESEKAKNSIGKIFHLSGKLERSDFRSYLDNLTNSEKINRSLKGTVLTAAIAKDLRDRNFENAEENCLTLVNNYQNTENEIYALYNLVNIYRKLNRFEEAKRYLEILQNKYPDHNLTCFAQAMLSGTNANPSKRQNENEPEENNLFTDSPQAETDYKLQAAYPNPFNPTTTISYNVSENAHVALKIYNTTGQEIATLVNGYQQAGSHQVRWNGKDNFGNQLPSGIYLYQIISGNFKKTGKMMLVK